MKNKENLIKSNERKQALGGVYSTPWIVKNVCDMLPEEAWNSHETITVPICGKGNFLVEITRRKMEHCKQSGKCDYLKYLNTIYGIDILPDNVEESKQRMLEIVKEYISKNELNLAKEILGKRIICGDSLAIMAKWTEEEEEFQQMSLF